MPQAEGAGLVAKKSSISVRLDQRAAFYAAKGYWGTDIEVYTHWQEINRKAMQTAGLTNKSTTPTNDNSTRNTKLPESTGAGDINSDIIILMFGVVVVTLIVSIFKK